MPERIERLKATVRELEAELHAAGGLDEAARDVLRAALREIRAALDEDDPTELQPQSLTDRLADATRAFEGSHPTLTGIVARLIDGLAQMGI